MDELIKAQSGRGDSGRRSQSAMFGAIKRPKAFLAQSWSSGVKAVNALNDSFNDYLKDGRGGSNGGVGEDEEDGDDEQWTAAGQQRRRRRNAKSMKKETVSAWFPEPGNNNVFHTVALFALFVQKCCGGKLAGISLKDQRCTLLDAIKQ